MTDPAEAARQHLLLLAWFSPAFPVGGFAFSHGLEWAYETGTVVGRAALEGWLADVLAHGSGRADAILAARAWTAVAEADGPGLQHVIDLAAALQPSSERYLEASVQGTAFLGVVRAAYPSPRLDAALAGRDLERLTLPVAAGLAAASHDVALLPFLTAYLAAFTANLVSAAVRLGVVGQTDGQRVTAALQAQIPPLAGAAAVADLSALGSATLHADLVSLQHETQYSRLFRS